MPVLLVEADAEERIRFGTWLEEAGFDLLTCPGPTEPDYTCIGGRTGVCPLAAEASIVVLDIDLESEAVVMGTAAEDLLGMYLLSGHRVVVLGSRGGEEIPGRSSASDGTLVMTSCSARSSRWRPANPIPGACCSSTRTAALGPCHGSRHGRWLRFSLESLVPPAAGAPGSACPG